MNLVDYKYPLIFGAGILAAVINVVGGGGSILTLPALMFLGGLSGSAANATNRIGIIAQNIMAVSRFRKGGVKEDKITWRLALAGLPGVYIGAQLASWIPERTFDTFLAILMLALLVLILFKPKPKLTKEHLEIDAWAELIPQQKFLALVVFFFIGIYMGLIQAGAGILILVALGWLLRLDLVRGNYIKLFFILILNIIAFSVFLYNGLHIDWIAGVVLFSGQVVGAYVGSWVALKRGEKWMKVILTVSILASSAKLLGLFKYLGW